MAYPNITQNLGSEPLNLDGAVLERAESGRPRIQALFSRVWCEFSVMHECTLEEKDTIWAFYLANRRQSFQFTWAGDSQTYTVQFVGPPKTIPIEGSYRWRVTSSLVEVDV